MGIENNKKVETERGEKSVPFPDLQYFALMLLTLPMKKEYDLLGSNKVAKCFIVEALLA